MIEVEATDGLRDLAAALRGEEDGVKLRRDLAKNLRTAVAPAVAEAKSAILAATGGIPHAGSPLGPAIAQGVTAQARLSGQRAGVKVRARTVKLRGFKQAPRRFNRAKGWRHPVFGNRQVWVHQMGAPGWFDDPLKRRRAEYRAAAEQAMQDTVQRITRRAG